MVYKKTPQEIWGEYEKAVSYKHSINLYEQVEQNENFFIGKQWEGVNAPDLPKPVINILKRVVSYFIAMIVSDDIGIQLTPYRQFDGAINADLQAEVLSNEVDKAIEYADIKAKARKVVRNAAVDGDGALYFYWDEDAKPNGHIKCELIDNTNILPANPHSDDIQEQKYIIIEQQKTLDEVRDEAKENGISQSEIDTIAEDKNSNIYDVSENAGNELVTVLIKLWRENGVVKAIKVTRNVVIKKEWNTGYSLYPLAVMAWERVKNSCHGQAAITGLIPNQISINQLFAMAIHSVKSNAFPKIIYDASRIPTWSNKVGQAIQVHGDPNTAIASNFKGADMSNQVMELIDSIIQKTLEFMGASDAALGNVKPVNTSAIIATQKAAAMPLELQRLEYYRFTESYIRILLDMMRSHYGVRYVEAEINGELYKADYDFSTETAETFNLQVDIGSSAYWNELMQIQTQDNLFEKGIITDAITYLEGIPDQYIKGKAKMIADLKNKQEAMQMQAPMQAQPVQPIQPPML